MMLLQRIRTVIVQPAVVYGLLSLVILGPLLRPGYVLTLDMVFTPTIRTPEFGGSGYAFYGLLHVLNLVIAADVIQKALLFTIFLSAGWGMHRLAALVGESSPKTALDGLPRYVAGVLYAANPFTYDRLMAGQYGVLLGYALLPWFARSLLRLAAKPGWRPALAVAGWAIAVGMVSVHGVGLMIILGLLVLATRFSGALLGYAGIATGVWLATNSFWLVPALAGRGQTAETVASFTTGDRQAFATVGGSVWGRLDNVLSLQGFWAESRGLFRLPQDVVSAWNWLFAGLLLLVVVGVVVMWRRQRRTAGVFAASSLIAVFLATGIGGNWLAAHLPFFAGYREPQKFVMLVAMGYAVFTAYGAQAVLVRFARWRWAGLGIGACMLALPLLLAPTLLWGANGQLRATQFPEGWYAANGLLNKDTDDFQTLFLPWHLYMDTNFAGRIVANPAPDFFDKPVIANDDPEFNGAAHAVSSGVRPKVTAALAAGPKSNSQLGRSLAALDVKYIVVAKTSDYQRYGYLDRQSNITLYKDYGTLLVYRNDAR